MISWEWRKPLACELTKRKRDACATFSLHKTLSRSGRDSAKSDRE